MNKTHIKEIVASVSWLLTVALSAHAAPGDVLFSDSFEDGTLAPWTTSNAGRSGVNNAAGWSGSGSYGAYTRNQPVTVTSPAFNAAVPAARLQLWVRRGADSFSEDTDPNEDLVLEYRDAGGTWNPLNTWFGSGTNGQVYNASFILPAAALHGTLAIRLRQTQGSGFNFDYWHFDNVVVTEVAVPGPLIVGGCDDFEFGLGTNWNITASSGIAGISTATSQSPSNSLYLNAGVVTIESNDLDVTDITFSDVTMWIRRGSDAFSEDPDTGENLVVEYRDPANTWVTLETFSGAGGPGAIFIRSYPIPVADRHANFRVRFRLLAGSGPPYDYWHIDDVCLAQDPNPILSLTKVSALLSDPINGSSSPKAIPGAEVEYTISLTNQGIGSVDADSLVITDPVPANTALYVATTGGDPIAFVDGSPASGLSFNYATDVTFSNQVGGGPPFNYTPVPDAQGFDPAVTGYRVAPTGAMNPASGGNEPSFDIVFRVRIE